MKFKNLHKILIFLSLIINTIEAEDIYKVEVIIIKFKDVIVDENFNAVGLNKDFVFTLLFETKSVVDTIGLKTADSLKEIEKLQKLQFIARQ